MGIIYMIIITIESICQHSEGIEMGYIISRCIGHCRIGLYFLGKCIDLDESILADGWQLSSCFDERHQRVFKTWFSDF